MKEGKAEIVTCFLDNQYPTHPNALEDGFGYLALAACHRDSLQFIPRLELFGCDLKTGKNPLIFAAQSGCDFRALPLLDDRRALNMWGHDAMVWSLTNDHMGHCTTILLDRGIDPLPVLEHANTMTTAIYRNLHRLKEKRCCVTLYTIPHLQLSVLRPLNQVSIHYHAAIHRL